MSESDVDRSDVSRDAARIENGEGNDNELSTDRRQTLGWLGKAGLAAGLTAAYGTLAAFMGRFLYPAGPPPKGWMLVSKVDEVPDDGALLYRTPAGRTAFVGRHLEIAGEPTAGTAFLDALDAVTVEAMRSVLAELAASPAHETEIRP